MDYEKKYKEILEAVKQLRDSNPSDEGIQNWVSDNFPELKPKEESEDERMIRIIENLICTNAARAIAKDIYNLELTDIADWLEKRGRQKLMEQAEPKFKVGDWITNGKLLVGQVTSFDGEYYRYMCDGLEQPLHVSNAHKWHLWTIQDAKDGDIIVTGRGNIFIFHEIKDNDVYDYCGVYCGIHGDSVLCGSGIVNEISATGYRPATKEQRECLFQKIHDYGFEWDSDKKSLYKYIEE